MNDILLPDEIVDLEDVAPHPNILVFAKSGVGKSVFAGSDDRILFLNCEAEGTISTRRFSQGKFRKQWLIQTWDDWEKATTWIKDTIDKCVKEGKEFPFQWVVVDTLTTLQNRILMRHLMDQAYAKNSNRDPNVPDKPEYLKSQLMIQRAVKEMNDLPVCMLYLAHVMQHDDPEGNAFLFPAIQGKRYEVAQAVLAMMTSFGYMYVATRKKDGKTVVDAETRKPIRDRIIQWEDYNEMQGKDRTGVLGDRTRNITLRAIRQRMKKRDEEAKAEREKGKEQVRQENSTVGKKN